jgi:hypothetical protein
MAPSSALHSWRLAESSTGSPVESEPAEMSAPSDLLGRRRLLRAHDDAIDQITHAISLRQHGHMFTLRLISPRCLTILAYIADLPAERSRPGAKLARPLTRARAVRNYAGSRATRNRNDTRRPTCRSR